MVGLRLSDFLMLFIESDFTAVSSLFFHYSMVEFLLEVLNWRSGMTWLMCT